MLSYVSREEGIPLPCRLPLSLHTVSVCLPHKQDMCFLLKCKNGGDKAAGRQLTRRKDLSFSLGSFSFSSRSKRCSTSSVTASSGRP